MKRMFALLTASCFLAACSGAEIRGVPALPGSMPLVSFVFDDGNDTDYLIARKIFSEHGAVACSAITTDLIGTRDHLNRSQMEALKESGWEIMGHTASHSNLRFMNRAEIDNEFARSTSVLEGMGMTIKNVVYPFNMNNKLVREVAAGYYRSGRGGTNSFNTEQTDPYHLRSFTLKHDTEGMKQLIDRAYADRKWLIFYAHELNTKVRLSGMSGEFTRGETVTLSPSGTVATYVTTHWYPVYGYSVYLVPLSGAPGPGDTVTGATSGATAKVDRIVYDEPAQLSEMLGYIRNRYPEMRIVTIDQGLDLLGMQTGFSRNSGITAAKPRQQSTSLPH